MIAVATTSRRSIAAREQWANPRSRARLLARQILASERRRVDRLVAENTGLCDLAAGFFYRRFGKRIPREDLAASAFFGLRRAAEMFDETKGAQFHTYAFNWLRAEINNEFFRSRSVIRVPRRPVAPTPKVGSIDAPRGDDNGTTFGALLVDEDAADPLNEAHRSDLRSSVAEALKTLRPRDATVLRLKFGLEGHAPHTITEVAQALGVCTSRARQIEARALSQLRIALASLDE